MNANRPSSNSDRLREIEEALREQIQRSKNSESSEYLKKTTLSTNDKLNGLLG